MGVKVVLNMIMKNEARAGVLLRGLETIKHIFHHYAISDTGSDDGSVKIVKKWMEENGKTGLINVKPWEDDFGKHRTWALDLAYEFIRKHDPKGEHVYFAMFHDADNQAYHEKVNIVPKTLEEAKKVEKFPWNRDITKGLEKYNRVNVNMTSSLGRNIYSYCWMVNLGTALKPNPWRWLCSRHEYADYLGKQPNNYFTAKGGIIFSGRDGARGKTLINGVWKDNISMEKYWKDAMAMEKELQDPSSPSPKPRLIFYMANSYKDAGWWEKAAVNYEKRTMMGDFMEEVFHSYIQLFHMSNNLGRRLDEGLPFLFQAINLFPHRLEAVNTFVEVMIKQNQWAIAWLIGKPFIGTPYPKNELLFVDKSLYDWRFSFNMLQVCYYAGCYKVNVELSQGKIDDIDVNKMSIAYQKNANEYKALVNSMLKNEHVNKKDLDQYVRNTIGIWNEDEKKVFYRLFGTNKEEEKKFEITEADKEFLSISSEKGGDDLNMGGSEDGPVGFII